MLDSTDSLCHSPRRVLVAGVTGVGKSTLCRRLAVVLGLPYVELDSLHHGPNWTPLASFEGGVDAFIAGPQWVSEWQYSVVRDRMLGRADTLVWLDYPRRVALGRLVKRTIGRRIRREVLWNGNVEPPLRTFFTDPEANIIRWEMKTHAALRGVVPALEERSPQLQIVRIAGQRELDAWLAGPLAARPASAGS